MNANSNADQSADQSADPLEGSGNSVLLKAMDETRSACENYWWKSLVLPSDIANLVSSKGVKRILDDGFMPAAKKQKQIDICVQLESLCVIDASKARPYTAKPVKMFSVDAITTGLNTMCLGKCCSQNCDVCETFSLMKLYEASNHVFANSTLPSGEVAGRTGREGTSPLPRCLPASNTEPLQLFGPAQNLQLDLAGGVRFKFGNMMLIGRFTVNSWIPHSQPAPRPALSLKFKNWFPSTQKPLNQPTRTKRSKNMKSSKQKPPKPNHSPAPSLSVAKQRCIQDFLLSSPSGPMRNRDSDAS